MTPLRCSIYQSALALCAGLLFVGLLPVASNATMSRERGSSWGHESDLDMDSSSTRNWHGSMDDKHFGGFGGFDRGDVKGWLKSIASYESHEEERHDRRHDRVERYERYVRIGIGRYKHYRKHGRRQWRHDFERHGRHHYRQNWHDHQTPPVPEPSTAMLMLLGLAGLGTRIRRDRVS